MGLISPGGENLLDILEFLHVPQKLEHNDIQWITPTEIPDYAFCLADEEILTRILGL